MFHDSSQLWPMSYINILKQYSYCCLCKLISFDDPISINYTALFNKLFPIFNNSILPKRLKTTFLCIQPVIRHKKEPSTVDSSHMYTQYHNNMAEGSKTAMFLPLEILFQFYQADFNGSLRLVNSFIFL